MSARRQTDWYNIYITRLGEKDSKRKKAAILVGVKHTREIGASSYDYERRNGTLRAEGFLPWERYWLCQGTILSPTMKEIRRERAKLYNRVKRGDLIAYNTYARAIGDMYRDNGWTFRDGRLDPFKLIDWVNEEHDWEQVSPGKKRRILRGDYQSKKRATMEKRRG